MVLAVVLVASVTADGHGRSYLYDVSDEILKNSVTVISSKFVF